MHATPPELKTPPKPLVPAGPKLTPPSPEDKQAQRDRQLCREVHMVRGTLWLVLAALIVGWGQPIASLLLVPPCLLVAVIMLNWPQPR